MDDTTLSRPTQPSASEDDATQRPRRPWIAPALMRHASLTVLTQQYPPSLVVDPATGELLDPNNPEHRVRLADVPGSTGFFP
jgi:hypothetical protein